MFRVGCDQSLTDDQGNSRISAEGYAIAVVIELESASTSGALICVAY